eukprot:5511159-Lingulodinium_polyedra.AAC.1
MLKLSRGHFMKYAGLAVRESKFEVVASEIRRVLRRVRWPRPVRLRPHDVPEERRNYACQRGASVKSRGSGGRRC